MKRSRYSESQITGLETKEMLGNKRVFYVGPSSAVQYWLPISETESGSIHPIKSPELFIEALAILSEFQRSFSRLSFIFIYA